jgi:HD-like signal output (HDOD) protein
MDSKNINKSLKTILNNWKFPQDVIDKYESIKIFEVFEWQAECLQLISKLSKFLKYYSIYTVVLSIFVMRILK